MATNKGKKSSAAPSATKITRIKASDSAPKTKTTKVKAATSAPKKAEKAPAAKETHVAASKASKKRPLNAFFGYFKGAWYELKQVRWPNRQATLGMTAALIGFTAFFTVFILLLDALFKYSFELMLG